MHGEIRISMNDALPLEIVFQLSTIHLPGWSPPRNRPSQTVQCNVAIRTHCCSVHFWPKCSQDASSRSRHRSHRVLHVRWVGYPGGDFDLNKEWYYDGVIHFRCLPSEMWSTTPAVMSPTSTSPSISPWGGRPYSTRFDQDEHTSHPKTYLVDRVWFHFSGEPDNSVHGHILPHHPCLLPSLRQWREGDSLFHFSSSQWDHVSSLLFLLSETSFLLRVLDKDSLSISNLHPTLLDCVLPLFAFTFFHTPL